MSTPDSPQPRSGGAHRAAPASGPPTTTPLLLPLLSVVAVLGAMALAAWMLMTSGDDEVATPTPTGAASQPTTQPSDEPSDDPAEPTDEPSDEPSGGEGNGGGGGGDSQNEPSARPIPQVPVYVFNQTTIGGLAAQTGGELESLGWNVVGADNWVGVVPDDTVYFYPGDRRGAEHLAKAAGIRRVWPASAPMPAGALTIILADTDRK